MYYLMLITKCVSDFDSVHPCDVHVQRYPPDPERADQEPVSPGNVHVRLHGSGMYIVIQRKTY